MRRGPVGEGRLRLGLPLGLALPQEGEAAGGSADLALLPGDHVGEILNAARQVGEALLDLDHAVHRRSA